MTVPRKEILFRVQQWVTNADDDLRVAQYILNITERCPYRLVAYHAQQCAEKYFKAYLVLHGTDFPYTHNIARLLELCPQYTDWCIKLKDAEELTPYAITARYPGMDEPVKEAEARRAVDIAALVRTVVRQTLEKEGARL